VADAKLLILWVDESFDDAIRAHQQLKECGVRNPICGFQDPDRAREFMLSRAAGGSELGLVVLALDLSQKVLGFLEWLRSRPEWSSLPVIVLANERTEEQQDRAVQLGVWGCYPRGTDLKEVADYIRREVEASAFNARDLRGTNGVS
jgi:hypothetical protein